MIRGYSVLITHRADRRKLSIIFAISSWKLSIIFAISSYFDLLLRMKYQSFIYLSFYLDAVKVTIY